jgi:hypothetical protein
VSREPLAQGAGTEAREAGVAKKHVMPKRSPGEKKAVEVYQKSPSAGSLGKW